MCNHGFYRGINMQMTRTVHPVGQGTFYTEEFYRENDLCLRVAFDCGGNKIAKTKFNYPGLDNITEKVVSDGFIDIQFVSHFHNDHINGLMNLINKGKIKKIYIPFVSPATLLVDIFYNILEAGNVKNDANDFILNYVLPAYNLRTEERTETNDGKNPMIQVVERDTIIPVLPIENVPIWFYKLVWKEDKTKAKALAEEIRRHMNLLLPTDYNKSTFEIFLLAFVYNEDFQWLKKLFSDHFPEGHNSYSMMVLSHPVCGTHIIHNCNLASCLYTGDAPVSDRMIQLIYSEEVDVLQVPHHGSRHNFSRELYHRWLNAFISFGEKNQYHHPGKYELCQIANSCSSVHLVTEDQRTLWCEDVPFVI